MNVIITGANGFVGRNIGLHLAENGFEVTGIVRGKKVVPFPAVSSKDLTETRLGNMIKNSDALVHLVGQGKQTVCNTYENVNVSLTRNAVTLCKRAGIKKIIYMSGLGVDKSTTLGYFISKYNAEQEIVKSGLDYTIFRASYIVGKDDPLSKTLQQQIRKGKIIIPGSGNYRFQPIFVDDVSKIIGKTIVDKKLSNKIIDLVGPQIISYNLFVKKFLHGRNVPIQRLDFEDAYNNALHGKGSFGVDDLAIMAGDYIGNHKKLASLAEMKFTRWDEILKSCSLS
ncbi:MAG: NAD(P)H-binding protein [Thaumarchaeota archaeon]|nr:NAD(P)H-binding protein [Nitrososphaerota archaeon]